MLSRGDTEDRLAEVDEVLGCLVVQTVEHHDAELERDPLRLEPRERVWWLQMSFSPAEES